MGPIWGVTMNEKNQQLLWDPICGYCDEWKTSDYYGILYVGITMNETNDYYINLICGYCNECVITSQAYMQVLHILVVSNAYYKILYVSITLNSNT